MVTIMILALALTTQDVSERSVSDPSLPASRMQRVRDIGDPTIAALLVEGAARSTTFKRLVDIIDSSNGIVYVEAGQCGHGVQACLAMTVIVAGPNRLLRIIVNPHREHRELVAAIGHELQHAVEVLSDPCVTDAQTFYWFYDRLAPTSKGRFETQAAIYAGYQVGSELKELPPKRR